VLGNSVLRRIFGPKRDDMIESWRKLHSEELCNLYPSSDIIKMTKSRRMECTGPLACMRKKRNAYRVLLGKPESKRQLGRAVLGAKIILKWIFEN
jgi:hypothetical protein